MDENIEMKQFRWKIEEQNPIPPAGQWTIFHGNGLIFIGRAPLPLLSS